MVDAGTGGPSMPGVSTDKSMVVKRNHRSPFMDLLNSLKPATNAMEKAFDTLQSKRRRNGAKGEEIVDMELLSIISCDDTRSRGDAE